jgi:SAM-dependent methyltransferase
MSRVRRNKEEIPLSWDSKYLSSRRIWGQKPSELAVASSRYLVSNGLNAEKLSIIDIGCGYGRDSISFSQTRKCSVLGIDISEKAIKLALDSRPKTDEEDLQFQCRDFKDLKDRLFDIVFASNLYHLLRPDDRHEFRSLVRRTLKLDGLLFLLTLSVNDPEHYGKGTAVPDDAHSFQDQLYFHLSTRKELAADFAFLDIRELYEHEYYEDQASGTPHHHVSWILIGQKKSP